MTTTDDLNASLARLMGWTNCANQNHTDDYPASQCWVRPGGVQALGGELPDWADSLDALFAPGGPVEYAAKKGLGSPVVTSGMADGVLYLAVSVGAGPIHVAVGVGKLAEALATALHEAFMKEQGR